MTDTGYTPPPFGPVKCIDNFDIIHFTTANITLRISTDITCKLE